MFGVVLNCAKALTKFTAKFASKCLEITGSTINGGFGGAWLLVLIFKLVAGASEFPQKFATFGKYSSLAVVKPPRPLPSGRIEFLSCNDRNSIAGPNGQSL